jgi:hypothetical protein
MATVSRFYPRLASLSLRWRILFYPETLIQISYMAFPVIAAHMRLVCNMGLVLNCILSHEANAVDLNSAA